jgi:hypothetical protein
MQREVQLITPAILIVLLVSLVTYTVVAAIPFIPITIAGMSFGVTGIVCLACGLVAGMLFIVIARCSLRKSGTGECRDKKGIPSPYRLLS